MNADKLAQALRDLCKRWDDLAGENENEAARLAHLPVANELARDGSQYRQSASQVRNILAEYDAQPAQAAQPVGCLTVSRFRGADSMVNHDLDYYGDLPDGSYSVFVTPPAQPSADTEVSNEMVLRAVHASLDWPHPLTHFEARKALEAAMAQESDAARAAKCGES